MARKVGLGTAIFILSLCGSLEASELRVPGSFATIQEAIDAATNGDVVIVANGTYSGDGNRDLDFGGKAITVGSAKGAAKCIINCGGSESEPHRAFIFQNSEGSNSVVDGFTITNGYANDVYPEGAGGAIYIDGAGPTIQNCVINGNTAQGNYSGGGGIVCYDGDPVIRNCTITDNQSDTYGGGIYCERADAVIENCVITHNTVTGDYGNKSSGGGLACWDASPTVTGCTIQENVARYGGGVLGYNESSPQINDCVIQNNQATYRGGGGYIDYSAGVRFSQCTIRNNSADNGGGGLYFADSDPNVISCLVQENVATQFGGGIYTNDCTITVRRCEVLSNAAEGSLGGGLYFEYSNAVVEDTLIENNSSLQSGGGFNYYEYEGPATLMMRNCIIVGNRSQDDVGGVMVSRPAGAEITNCLIAGNRAENIIGGMEISSPAATVRNCTIFGNSAADDYGGLYFTYNSDITMSNCIVWGNSDGGSGYELAVLTSANPSTLSVSRSCIEQGQLAVEVAINCTLDWGPGNIQSEPNFVSPGYWDDNDTPEPEDDIWVIGEYHLLPGSDCIDAGDPNNIDPNEVDLAGNDRFLGSEIDMGAYENEPVDITVGKMTVKAGKTRLDQTDSCSISGTFAAWAESFEAADTVSLRAGVWSETLRTADFQQAGKGIKYTYKGPSGGITSMSLDFIKGIFTASGKELSLTGMTAPVSAALVMGDYYGFTMAEDVGDDDVINGKKSLPIQLLSGHTDTLQVTKKIKAKPGTENNVASLTIQGTFTSMETVNVTETGVTIYWGTDFYTIAGENFTPKGTDKYVGKKTSVAADPTRANVTLDFLKCTFKIVLKNTELTWQDEPVTFGLEFGSYNEVASAVLAATSRSTNDKIGTVIFLSFEGGFYGIVSDDGVKYDPINLPTGFAQDGKRIRFQAIERPDLVGVHQWGVIVEITEISAL